MTVGKGMQSFLVSGCLQYLGRGEFNPHQQNCLNQSWFGRILWWLVITSNDSCAEVRIRGNPHNKQHLYEQQKHLSEDYRSLKISTSGIYILKGFQKIPFCANLFFPSQRLNLMSHSSIVGCCSDIMTVSGTGTLAGGNEAILSDANTEDLVSVSELLAIWVTEWDFFSLCFSTILQPSSQVLCTLFLQNIFSIVGTMPGLCGKEIKNDLMWIDNVIFIKKRWRRKNKTLYPCRILCSIYLKILWSKVNSIALSKLGSHCASISFSDEVRLID